jgi:hypothetical protein
MLQKRFRAKWSPVRVKKTRQENEPLSQGSGYVGTSQSDPAQF